MRLPAYFGPNRLGGIVFAVSACLALGLLTGLLALDDPNPRETPAAAAKRLPVFAPFPQQVRESEPAQGKFLVASRDLRDPNFIHTVVLLVDYDAKKGAMGLVVNRATDVKLSDLLEIKGVEGRTETVYIGGPVAKTGILVLVRSGTEPDDASHVFDDIYVSSSRPLLEDLMNSPEGDEHFRLYAGYAGWAPGQLEFEIDRGSWHILPAEADAVFDPQPDKVWKRLIDRTSIRFARNGRRVRIKG